jgi:hypothetical protein
MEDTDMGAAKDPAAKWAKHAATMQAKRDGLPKRFVVTVWFATASERRDVATFGDYEAAAREARAYLGADARGVWINNEQVREG